MSKHRITLVAVVALVLATTLAGRYSYAAMPSFEEFDRRAKAGEPLSVVFFGGSLTWGANASNPQTTSYRALMSQYLQQKYPRTSFTFHDAAIGGTGSKLGMFRLERDVLAHKPDFVFLDFTANDDLPGTDIETLTSYESILRDMISRGIPVEQVFLGFKYNFGSNYNMESQRRYGDHMKIAAAYHTGIGDCFPYVQKKLTDKEYDLNTLWPFDGAHPDDVGYRLFFESVRDGFEQAIADKRVCVVPEKPVFSEQYRNRKRIILVDTELPAGWHKAKTYRTSLWFDGLASRWMGDVAMCDMKDKATAQPLKVEFSGKMVGLFGEADENGLGMKVLIDGKLVQFQAPRAAPADVWPFSTKRFGSGRLFIWREITDKLAPGKHMIEIQPVFDETATKGQLRIESICVAGDESNDTHHQ